MVYNEDQIGGERQGDLENYLDHNRYDFRDLRSQSKRDRLLQICESLVAVVNASDHGPVRILEQNNIRMMLN